MPHVVAVESSTTFQQATPFSYTPQAHAILRVSWYFELSQPQRITSQLKTMFNLPPIYSARKSSNNKSSKKTTTTKSVLTQIYRNIHKQQTQNCRQIRPFGTAPVKKKAHKAWTRWYRGPFRRFINTRFFFFFLI